MVALSAGAAACSSSGDSTDRNAAVVAGTKCKTAGEYKKVSGQKVVCGRSAGQKIWYGVAAVKKTKCRTLGSVRVSADVAFVCGKSKNTRVWIATKSFGGATAQVNPGLVSSDPAAKPGSADAPSEVQNTIAPPSDVAAPDQASATTTVDAGASNGATTAPADPAAPVTVPGPARAPGPYAQDMKAVHVAVSNDSACVVNGSWGISCWGRNDNGQLGDGTTNPSTVPVTNLVLNGRQMRTNQVVSGGAGDFCATGDNGTIWCWGSGANGQLGNGSRRSSAVPVQVQGFDGVNRKAQTLYADFSTFCAQEEGTGDLWCWGRSWGVSKWGVLGKTEDMLLPVKIPVVDTRPIHDVAVGQQSICAAEFNGPVWCWGNNARGALGRAPDTRDYAPSKVAGSGAGDFMANEIVGFRSTYCSLAFSGKVYCWGSTEYGLLGDPAAAMTGTLNTVKGFPEGDMLNSLTGGGSMFCAVMHSARLLCWGTDFSETWAGKKYPQPTEYGGYDGVNLKAREVGTSINMMFIINATFRLDIRGTSNSLLLGDGYTHAAD